VHTLWQDSNKAKDAGGSGKAADGRGGELDKSSGAAALKYGEPPGMVGTHVRLSPPTAIPTADGGVELSIPYEFQDDRRPGPDYVLVVVRPDGWTITPLDRSGMPTGRRGQFKLALGPEVRNGVEIWIGKVRTKPDATDPGLRVSDLIRYN
jgi:hypothetical protein